MAVLCPDCGWNSDDPEFCVRCGTDLNPAAAPPPADPSPDLPPPPSDQTTRLTRPDAAVVVRAGDRAWRWHWVPQESWEAVRPCVEERRRHAPAVLPPVHIIPGEGGTWVAAEAGGPRPQPWREKPEAGVVAALRHVAEFVGRLARALDALHAAGLVWLSFDPLALEEHGGGLRLTNLDLGAHAVGCPPGPSGLAAFEAPEAARGPAAAIGSRTDVYHLALFTYYWIGRFLPHGFFGQGLAAFAFDLPPVRVFEPNLPVGIGPVLQRGLAVDPARRPATPDQWAAEFRSAVEYAAAREAAAVRVTWETGFHTRVGRAKAALGIPNEDAGFVRRYADPDRVVAVVADGVSCCDVGSGRVASEITCACLASALGPDTSPELFGLRVAVGCVRAGDALLAWALEHGYHDLLADGADLMGATALAALCEGRTLHLANVGDSRAYLLDGTNVEQLTVDGDLGCALLSAGTPPETVRELGPAVRSLYSFVGGSTRNGAGEPAAGDRWEPTVSRWPLLPGDVVVLCSDGLVEEGAFLEPADVLDLVRRHADLSAQALAEKLTEAADDRQRLPTPDEPGGRGDNVTCCLLRVVEAP